MSFEEVVKVETTESFITVLVLPYPLVSLLEEATPSHSSGLTWAPHVSRNLTATTDNMEAGKLELSETYQMLQGGTGPYSHIRKLIFAYLQACR